MEVGRYVKQPQGYKAFILNLKLSTEIINKANLATLKIGKLDGITQLLPDVDFFIFMYIRKDATASSQIEGTQATIIDAIEAESEVSDTLPADVDDILHYIKALNYGLKRLQKLPLCLRLIKEIHRELMRDARKTHFSDPGNFRKTQNWIGGTSPNNADFIPPPPYEMKKALDDLENFLHKEDPLFPIVKAGIIHAQFETIHPFLDGNGRTGRLLITIYLHWSKLLEKPVLFLSSYFKKYRQVYYQRLHEYHEGKLDKWLDFFLDGVIETADEAVGTVKQITILKEEDMKKIQSLGKTAAESATKVLPRLFQMPIVNVSKIQKWTGFTRQGSQKVIDRLVRLGILEQKDKTKKYGRIFIYKRYLDIFKE